MENFCYDSFWHYCSRGLEREILFSSADEFVAGMNRAAVCHLLSHKWEVSVKILAFCLMDNHFHFILCGSEESCDRFANTYRRLTSYWIGKYRGTPLSEAMELGHWPVSRANLAEKIAYVLRNPLAAGMNYVPSGYRWSSGFLLFRDNSALLEGAKKAEDISLAYFRRITFSKEEPPVGWRVLPNGLIWPGDYVDASFCEKIFGIPGQYMFMMNNRNVDRATEEEMSAGSISLPDSEVRLRASELANGLGKERVSLCSAGERILIARALRKELGCNKKQLARITGLKVSDLEALV